MLPSITYCANIEGLFKELDIIYCSEQWRLFIDGSVNSVKVVLLHNGNLLPSIPIAYTTDLKENYNDVKKIMTKIKYESHNWKICCDLKMVAILKGLQCGYTKFMCYLCEFDTRDRTRHFKNYKWKERTDFIKTKFNVINEPLVNKNNVIIPPLHIKLGLMSSLIKTIKTNQNAINELAKLFPRTSRAKLENGVFTGPQITKIIKSQAFKSSLNKNELDAFKAFEQVVQNFLGKNKSANYEQIVKKLLTTYSKIKCNMSLKLHFLESHINIFPDNLAELSDEHGEKFHQTLLSFENRFKGKPSAKMLGDYCWIIFNTNK